METFQPKVLSLAERWQINRVHFQFCTSTDLKKQQQLKQIYKKIETKHLGQNHLILSGLSVVLRQQISLSALYHRSSPKQQTNVDTLVIQLLHTVR